VLAAAQAIRVGAVHVACSGGPDSVALVGLLGLVAPSAGVALSIGHVDHGLRSAQAAAAEASLVEAIASREGVPVEVTRLDLDAGSGLAERARMARYAALRDQARRQGAAWLALGHTGTDQVETVLMHLARGAGLDGLAGMRSVEADLMRPILDLDRDQTRQLCGRLGLRFVDDPTNVDARHPRVSIRQAVLPVLRRQNPRLERAVVGACRRVAQADEALQLWAAREVEIRRRHGGPWAIDAWEALPPAIGTRVVRCLCTEFGVDRASLGADVVDAIDAAARAQAVFRACGTPAEGVAPRRWDLRPKRRVVVDKRGIWVDSGPTSNH